MPHAGGVNPFARALQESEKSDLNQPKNALPNNSLFSQALARSQSGGSSKDFANTAPDWEKQQAEMLNKQKKEAARKKLHDQINPLDMVDVFNAQEERVKKEIDQVRYELKALASEVAHFHKDIDITLHQEVVNPGQEGIYYLNFFQQLRQFIVMLKQKIHSARTWARQMHAKNTKKKQRKNKFGAGIDVVGNVHEQGKSVHDMMHHENNMVYGG